MRKVRVKRIIKNNVHPRRLVHSFKFDGEGMISLTSKQQTEFFVELLYTVKNEVHFTLSLRRMAATLRCRVSQRRLPSWTMALRWLARSVRFSRARRRYWLLTSSNWVSRSCTCLWKP